MKSILVCNQKGGVGKSLCSDELAFSFERSKIPFNFYDLDNQGGTLHHTNKMENAEISIIDTPGALQKSLSDWIKESDLIIVPTKTTARDITPLMRMIKIISEHPEKKLLVVMNCYRPYKASKEFSAWFSNTYPKIPVVILSQAEAFIQAGAEGKSVVDYARRSKAAEQTKKFVNTVRDMIDIKEEII